METKSKIGLGLLVAIALGFGATSVTERVKEQGRLQGCNEIAEKLLSNPLMNISCLMRDGKTILKVQTVVGTTRYADLETGEYIDNFQE